MKTGILRLLLLATMLAAFPAMAEEGPGDSRKYLIRGITAIEMAKSEAELALAVKEFQRATELDPGNSAAWYNMGSVQAKLGRFDDAILSYRQYLRLSPKADDATKVEDEIIKLEFRKERADKVKAMGGTWVANDGTPYRLTMKGNQMILATDHHFVTENEVISTYTLVGSVPVHAFEGLVYRLERTGNALSGMWWHSAISADKCKVPEETGDVSGEIREADGAIVLSYIRNKYKASTQLSALSDDYCREVTIIEKNKVELTLTGPLPAGGINAYVAWPIPDHPQSVAILQVPPNTPESAAGLKQGDEILAIDGTPLKQLSTYEIWMKTYGSVGSEVTLSILQKGSGQPVDIRLNRTAVEAYNPQSESYAK